MTPAQTPLPRHLREKVNKLAHKAGLHHEQRLKADLTARLLEARAAGGFAAIGPVLEQIDQELGGSPKFGVLT